MTDLGPRPAGLPSFATSFVGRSGEIDAVARSVTAQRLVTLAGPGGSGKTRLAVEAVGAGPLHGFVELAAVAPGSSLPAAVLAGCGIRDEPGRDPRDRLRELLGRAPGLLVLDSCEHVRPDVAAVVSDLLRACPGLHVLATSRVSLGVDGETVAPVGGMPDDDGVTLFLEWARRVQPALPTDEETEAAARRICGLVDRLPLGIELAAAHSRALSLPAIEAGMADRMRFLTSRDAGLPARHRSLLASIGWSAALVDARARAALADLTVVGGRFTLDVALAVAGPGSRPAVESLVDHSLLQFDAAGDRYVVLDTVREYASPPPAEAHARLLRHVVELARAANSGLGRADDASLAGVTRDDPAIRSALADALRTGTGLAEAGGIVVDLAFAWSLRGRCAEGRDWAERIGSAVDVAVPGLAWATAFLTVYAGDLENGIGLAATAAADDTADPRHRARSSILVGMAQMFVDPPGAEAVLSEAAGLAALAGDDWGQVEALQTRAYTHLFRTDHDAALRSADDAGPALRRLGHPQLRAWDDAIRADVAAQRGRFAEACTHGRAGLAAAVGVGEPVSAGAALLPLVRALCALDRTADATAAVATHAPFVDAHPGLATAEGLALATAIAGSWTGTVDVHRLGDVLAGARAAAIPSMAGEVATLLAVARLAPTERDEAGDARGAVEAADEALAWAAAIGSREIGCAATLVRCAAERSLGVDPAERAHRALAEAAACGLRPLVADAFDVLAGLAVDAGRPPVAARLHAAAERLRGELAMRCSPLACLLRAVDLPAVAAALTPGERAAAEAEGARLGMARAVAYASRSRGRRTRPRTGWESLTPTERDVVVLAAKGLSNPAIGAELLITAGTVRTHLRSVFAKLGMTSRTELAAAAVRHGL